MENASTVLLLLPEREITSVDELNVPTETEERSPAAEVIEKVGTALVLNCQPEGAESVILVLAFHAPPVVPKFELPFSEIVMTPKVVGAGVAPSRAVLLHMPVPPVAGVTTIWPETATDIRHNKVSINTHCLPKAMFIIGNFINGVIFFFMFQAFYKLHHKHTDIKCF